MEKIFILKEKSGKRLDKFLSEEFFLFSRGELTKRIKNGKFLINGKIAKPSYILMTNDVIEFEKFEKENILFANPDVKLEIIYEDDNVIVINKPAGIGVHPDNFEKKNTLVNGLAAAFPEITAIHDETPEGVFRPAIVHRLDKETSGVIVVARNKKAFEELKKLFKERKVRKTYFAICEGIFSEKNGLIEKSIARSSDYRKQIIAQNKTKTKIRSAVTEYVAVDQCDEKTLVKVFPKTGRMHQIRVHLASIGHPVVGDFLYGKNNKTNFSKRHLLHAAVIEFELFEKKYSFRANFPDDMRELFPNIGRF